MSQHTMDNSNTVQFPPYLKRKLIYEMKRLGPFKCRAEIKSNGTGIIHSFSHNQRDVNGAKELFRQIVEEQQLVYENDLKKFKQGLEDPHEILAKELDETKVQFDPKSHHPTQVASYATNYSTSEPYIVVPGVPGIYNKPGLPINITSANSSTGGAYADINKAFFKHPLEPLLIACQNLIKDFSLSNYNILTDRSNFRKLLLWALDEDRSMCRVDFELRDGCLVLQRCDEEQSESNSVSHSSASLFEQKCFKKPSHVAYHVISTFDIGKNKVLMRYEVDGQMPPQNSEDAITAQLKGTSISDKKEKFKGSDVSFVLNGTQQEQLEYVELKTFMKDRYKLSDASFKPELSSIYFQSFIAGVNRFVFGLKESVFMGPKRKEMHVTKIVEETLESIEPYVDVTKMVTAMKKVVAMMEYVQKKMKEGVDKAAVLFDPRADKLLFYRRKGDPLIPTHFPFTK